MKKLLIFFVAFIISMSAFCQVWRLEGKETSNSKIRFGIKAGIAFANTKMEYSTATTPLYGKTMFKPGAMAGVFARIALRNKTFFQPELLMIGKGMKEYKQSYYYRTTRTYLELPLNIVYRPSVTKGSFFIGGGPAPSFYTGQNVFYYGYTDVKKFDVGINILTGYELPLGFSINLNYTYGVLNISRYKTDIPVTKNRCFGLTVSYTF